MREFVCPGCGVVVLGDVGTAQDPLTNEETCLFCAPHDPSREDLAILFLNDAQDAMLGSVHASLGATRRQEPPQRPGNVVVAPDQGQQAVALAEFVKEMLDVLYEDAKVGTPNQIIRDGGKGILDNWILAMRAKLLEAGERQSPFILVKEESEKVLGILELLHMRYVQAHRKYLESAVDKEEARKRSYTMFWHMGNLIRTGQLARTVSPWVTGKEAPRF